MDWTFIILAGSSGIVFAFADILLKYWSVKSNHWFMIGAFLLYIVAGLLLAFSFKRKEVAVALAVLLCFNLILIAVLGFTLFKETLGLKEIIGITFALIAIVVLSI